MIFRLTASLLALITVAGSSPAFAQTIPTSQFGVQLDRGTGIVIATFEREENRAFQYNPDEFGFPSDRDFKGRATSKGASIFAARTLSRTVAVGVEAGFASASFYKSPSDASTLAGRVHESGLSDLQVEVDYSFLGESRLRPAAFLVTEIALPHNTNKPLIGSPGVVVRPALGAFKHFGNTIVLARLAGEYDSDSGTALDWGEWGVEAGARIAGSFRITAGFEGTVGGSNNFDEVSLVTDARWTSRRGLGIRAQNSVGFTTNNKGYSPEVGIVFQF